VGDGNAFLKVCNKWRLKIRSQYHWRKKADPHRIEGLDGDNNETNTTLQFIVAAFLPVYYVMSTGNYLVTFPRSVR
jgi:hypothetical protein